MLHSKHFGERRLVTAYVEYTRHFGDLTVKFDINWACCGSQNLEQTEAFHKAIGEAISYLNHIRDNHTRAIANGMTNEEWMMAYFPEFKE